MIRNVGNEGGNAVEERRSYRERRSGGSRHIEREQRGLECIVHRFGDEAHFGEATWEEYVRRNPFREEVEESLDTIRFVKPPMRRHGRTFSTVSSFLKPVPSAAWRAYYRQNPRVVTAVTSLSWDNSLV